MHPTAFFPKRTWWVLALALIGLGSGTPLSATTVLPPDFTALVKESDYVVRAVVKSITAVDKAPPGRRPLIYSRIELDVRQVIAGNPPSPVILEVLGGKLGGIQLRNELAGFQGVALHGESLFHAAAVARGNPDLVGLDGAGDAAR